MSILPPNAQGRFVLATTSWSFASNVDISASQLINSHEMATRHKGGSEVLTTLPGRLDLVFL